LKLGMPGAIGQDSLKTVSTGVFKNRVLRRISGPRREEVMGGWRKMRDEEFHNLYSSPNIVRVISQGG
jgi:hypothetical protein